MKKISISLFLILFTIPPTFAHYLWLETDRTGTLGKRQEVRVHYGEYTYGVIEKVQGENFPSVAKFDIWVVGPDRTKTYIDTKASNTYYVGHFTPTINGTYTVVLNNNEIEVLDYTQWDFGIFKTHYHSTTKVQVGNSDGNTAIINEEGIAIRELQHEGDDIKLQVVFKGKPLPKNEFKIYVSDLWTKTLETDGNGVVTFDLPWKTKYTMETTFEERVPGRFKGKDYEFIWHCATYCITK